MAGLGSINLVLQAIPQEWEYYTYTHSLPAYNGEMSEELLNRLGNDKWQLVTVVRDQWVFIRPKSKEIS